jgi:hypothetical protein
MQYYNHLNSIILITLLIHVLFNFCLFVLYLFVMYRSNFKNNTNIFKMSLIYSVPGGKVNIPGGHSKQKSANVHGSYPEQLPRQSYFTVQEFGYGTQYCPLLSPYCAPLDFCIWGWMKSEVYRTKMDTRDKVLYFIMSRCTQMSDMSHPHTSCKVQWCWQRNFWIYIIIGKLYQLCHLNNKYRY